MSCQDAFELEQISPDGRNTQFHVVYIDHALCTEATPGKCRVIARSPPMKQRDVRTFFIRRGLSDVDIDELLERARARFRLRTQR
jgi:hypothetical protein